MFSGREVFRLLLRGLVRGVPLHQLVTQGDQLYWDATSDSVDNALFRKGLWDDTTLDMLNSAVNVDDIVSVTLSHGDWSTTLMPD